MWQKIKWLFKPRLAEQQLFADVFLAKKTIRFMDPEFLIPAVFWVAGMNQR